MEAMTRNVFTFLISSFFILLNATAAESIGKAISLEGEVNFMREKILKNISPGELLYAGDKVITGKRSSARFLLGDNTIIDLKELSQFTFNKLNPDRENREAEFSLDFGKIRASVNKKIESKNEYKIKTKATVFAVRGTDFSVSAEDRDAKLTVFEGSVLTRSDMLSESVPAGFALESKSDIFTKKQLSAAELESIFAASRAEDMTFFQNVVVEDFRVSRNFGSATVQSLSKMLTPPSVQIPQNAFKVPGVNQLSASAVAPGVLNYVITNVGVKIQ